MPKHRRPSCLPRHTRAASVGRDRAVVFDLDDTLYPERAYAFSGFAAVARDLAKSPAAANRLRKWMEDRFRCGRRERVFDALNERFDLGLSARDIARLVRVYRNHKPGVRPYPGVIGLLRELRRRGWRIGLLADGYLPAQRLKFAALGLADYFDAVVYNEAAGRAAWKPSTAGFERIARLLNVPHGQCVYVGDNPAKDFLPGNRLGWLTVQWVRRGQLYAANPAPRGGRARKTVHTCGELLTLLADHVTP